MSVFEQTINDIIDLEWSFFDKVRNVGGRASCQDDWKMFHAMRACQFAAWDEDVLESYLGDLKEALAAGRNPVEQKYAYMMRFDDPDYFETRLKPYLPPITNEKQEIVDEIMRIQDVWYAQIAEHYPNVVGRGRPSRLTEGNGMVSVDVYLWGELCTYSMRTLRGYLEMLRRRKRDGRSLVREIYENTARSYGYESLDAAEAAVRI